MNRKSYRRTWISKFSRHFDYSERKKSVLISNSCNIQVVYLVSATGVHADNAHQMQPKLSFLKPKLCVTFIFIIILMRVYISNCWAILRKLMAYHDAQNRIHIIWNSGIVHNYSTHRYIHQKYFIISTISDC